MALSLETTQKVDLTVASYDDLGHPTPFESAPNWNLTDSAVLEVLGYSEDFSVATVAFKEGTADGTAAAVTCEVNGVNALPFELVAAVPVPPVPVTASVVITAGEPVDR